MKMFAKLKYVDDAPLSTIALCLNMNLEELKILEAELLRHHRQDSAIC
jgi:hypothetical protein